MLSINYKHIDYNKSTIKFMYHLLKWIRSHNFP